LQTYSHNIYAPIKYKTRHTVVTYKKQDFIISTYILWEAKQDEC